MTPTEIRAARKSLGLTQKCFGEMLHATERTVQMWEAGDRNMPAATQELLMIKEKTMKNEMTDVEYHASLAAQGFRGEPWTVRTKTGVRMGHSGPSAMILAGAAEELLAVEELRQSTPAARYALEGAIRSEWFGQWTAPDQTASDAVAAEVRRRFALLPA